MSELVISSLSISRSELPVVTGIDARVESGSISVVLGANGAGKTTLLEGLSGIIPVASGTIAINGHEIQKARPGQRSRQGLAHVEQGRTIFSQLTTEENMKVALRDGSDLSEAYGLFPELLQRRTVRAGLLSGGEQQMLVIARALLTQPKVLMIDEMSAGLAPVIVSRLMAAVRKLLTPVLPCSSSSSSPLLRSASEIAPMSCAAAASSMTATARHCCARRMNCTSCIWGDSTTEEIRPG